MSFTFTSIAEQLKSLFNNSKTTLKNLVVVILVFGLEQIFEKAVFKCPASDHHFYGLLFIVGPAVCLFNLTLLLHTRLWDVVTGCRRNHFSCQYVSKKVLRAIFQALLPAGVWVGLALVQSRYFVCTILGPKEQAMEAAKNDTQRANIERKYALAEAQSQILAWVIFDSIIVAGTLAVCVRRCCFYQAEGSLPNIYDYERMEADAAVAKFREQMDEEAKKAGETFVERKFEDCGVEGYEKVRDVRREVAKKYPRSTGDLSKPYRKQNEEISPRTEPNMDGRCSSGAYRQHDESAV